jgi:hypothetical protein
MGRGILIDDSITYMTAEEDLSAAFESAYRHLKAGGVMITVPDVCKDNFLQNRTVVSAAKSTSKPANVDVIFIENSYDPDPDDNTYEVNFVFIIREGGELKIEHDVHTCGLFKLDKWRELLKDCGFQVYEERRPNDSVELPIFVCVKTGVKSY